MLLYAGAKSPELWSFSCPSSTGTLGLAAALCQLDPLVMVFTLNLWLSILFGLTYGVPYFYGVCRMNQDIYMWIEELSVYHISNIYALSACDCLSRLLETSGLPNGVSNKAVQTYRNH